jgi:cytochrome o ubiquinol oxidase subunit 1
MVIGGVLFGYFAGLAYWFPKITGYALHEKLGTLAFWLWLTGFAVAFIPLYALGLMGMTRRLSFVDPGSAYHPLLVIAAVGACIIAAGVATQILQLIVSALPKYRIRAAGDYWNGRTLEWSTTSPAPLYNFARIPDGGKRDAFWEMKREGVQTVNDYAPIELPKNSAIGLIIAAAVFMLGFGIVWHIWWVLPIALVVVIAAVLYRTFEKETEYVVPMGTVAVLEQAARSDPGTKYAYE